MFRNARYGALFALVALLATAAFAPSSALASTGKASACGNCHTGTGPAISTTLVSTIGSSATYDFSAPGASAFAIFNGSTKVAEIDAESGTFMVPVGVTYTLFAVNGPGESDGLTEVSLTPAAGVVDAVAPVTTSDAVASYVSLAAINLTATDAGTGVANTYYTVDGGSQMSGTAIAVTTLGSHTISFWSVDVAGNIEAPKTASFTITAPTPVDTTAPVTTTDAVATYVTSAAINLTATDSGSGVANTYYTVDGGTQMTGTAIDVTTLGSHTISFYSVDVAGNIEIANTASFTITEAPVVIDTVAPVTTSDANPTYVTSAAINLTATDAGSGVANTYYTLDGGTLTTGTAIAASTVGTHTISFYSVDVAGNTEIANTASFTITEAPVASDTTTTTLSIRASSKDNHDSHNNHGRFYSRHQAAKTVSLSGKLTPGAKDLPISLYIMKDGSTTWELVKVIETKGSHDSKNSSWNYKFTPEDKGDYQLQVRFAGTSTLSPSESRIITVTAH